MTDEAVFHINRGRVWIALLAVFGFGVMMLLFAFFYSGAWQIICLIVAAGCVWGTVMVIGMLLDPRPLLRISAEGLYYRLFAGRSVPWPEITELRHVLGYAKTVVWGRVQWVRAPSADLLSFNIADLRPYPNDPGRAISRWVQRMDGAPPIAIQLWYVDAPAETVLAEIRKYWRGAITEIHRLPADVSA